MRPDDGRHGYTADRRIREELEYLRLDLRRQLLVVGIRDIDRIGRCGIVVLRELFYNCLDRERIAALLAYGFQLAVGSDTQERLDIERASDDRGSGADASAALEILEILHEEPVAQTVRDLLKVGSIVLDAHALSFVAKCPLRHDGKTARSAQRIDRDEAAAGIVLVEHRLGDQRGAVCGGETAREGQAKHGYTLIEPVPRGCLVHIRGDLAGMRQIAAALRVIKGLECLPAFGSGAGEHLIVQRVFHGEKFELPVGRDGEIRLAGHIQHYHVVHKHLLRKLYQQLVSRFSLTYTIIRYTCIQWSLLHKLWNIPQNI